MTEKRVPEAPDLGVLAPGESVPAAPLGLVGVLETTVTLSPV